MAEEFVKGVLWLSAGGLLATLISGITSILVARVLGPEQYGLYSLAFGAAGPLALATWFGVNTIAVKRAAESPGEAERVLDSALTFALVNAAAVAVAGAAAAPLLAKMISRPELAQAVAAAAVAVAAGQAAEAARLLVAVNKADAPAKVGVALQAARLSLAVPLAAYAGYLGGVAGNAAAYVVAAVAAVALYLRAVGKWRPAAYGWRGMLRQGIPLWAPTIIAAAAGAWQAAAVGRLLTNEEAGNYSVASNFATLAGVVAGPVATMALPHIAASEDREDALRRVARAGALVGVPVGAYLAVFAGPLVAAVYGRGYSLAPAALAILAMQYFLTAAGAAGLGAYLVARGRTAEILKANAAQYAVLSALVWPATAAWGIAGLAAAAVAAQAAGAAYMFAAAKRLGARPPVVLRPAVSAALAAGAAAPALLIGANPWIRVAASLAIYSVVYVAVALKAAALRRGDLEMLGKALARMPAARPLIAFLTRYAGG